MKLLLLIPLFICCNPSAYDQYVQEASDVFYNACSALANSECQPTSYEITEDLEKAGECEYDNYHIKMHPTTVSSRWVTVATWHELGHCALGRKHNDSECANLMSPTVKFEFLYDNIGTCTGDEFRKAMLRGLITDDVCYASSVCKSSIVQ